MYSNNWLSILKKFNPLDLTFIKPFLLIHGQHVSHYWHHWPGTSGRHTQKRSPASDYQILHCSFSKHTELELTHFFSRFPQAAFFFKSYFVALFLFQIFKTQFSLCVNNNYFAQNFSFKYLSLYILFIRRYFWIITFYFLLAPKWGPKRLNQTPASTQYTWVMQEKELRQVSTRQI